MGLYERVTANDPDGGGPEQISDDQALEALQILKQWLRQ